MVIFLSIWNVLQKVSNGFNKTASGYFMIVNSV